MMTIVSSWKRKFSPSSPSNRIGLVIQEVIEELCQELQDVVETWSSYRLTRKQITQRNV